MMKGLLENECGAQNPLIKLTSHFTNASEQLRTQDQVKSQHNQLHSKGPIAQAECYVSEYLGIDQKVPAIRRTQVPRTFQMEKLLNELKQIETTNTNGIIGNRKLNTPAMHGPASNTHSLFNGATVNSLSNEWSQEYWSSMLIKQSPMIIDDRAFKWSADYLTHTEATVFDETWGNLMLQNSNIASNNFMFNSSNNEAIASNATNNNQLNEEMRKTANELLDSMQDSRFSESEFLQFVRNLSQNNAAVNGASNEKQTTGLDDSTYTELTASNATESVGLNEEENSLNLNEADLSNEWVREFQSLTYNNGSESKEELDEAGFSMNDERLASSFWTDLQDEWNTAAASEPNHPWLDDFQKVFDTYKTYEFDKENPLESHPNPFEEGQERLKQHDIVNAVLLFEVAVQKEPNNMLAWQYLGTTQVENEQDAQAIRALRKCLELKADNLTALSTLATSYTNESMQRLAFYSLVKWLKYHPVYSHLLKNDEQAARLLAASETMNETETPFYMATLSVVHAGDFIDLQEVFLRAVRESASTPNKIDPNLQCCLGVLFHLSGEYDKAADCFKTALQIKPNDHLLWNKLGATFANSNRNEEAIEAYYQALKLCPGFVRARYNLGIGCMNLGAYKEAVEHFLTALVQQSQANLSQSLLEANNLIRTNNSQQMSETIWSTLRLALSYLNRSDLYSYCLNKDLDHLKQEFQI